MGLKHDVFAPILLRGVCALAPGESSGVSAEVQAEIAGGVDNYMNSQRPRRQRSPGTDRLNGHGRASQGNRTGGQHDDPDGLYQPLPRHGAMPRSVCWRGI